MKSWISFLLPHDEYREKKLLYFVAEGAVILFLFLCCMFVVNKSISHVQIDLELMLLLAIGLFSCYVLFRYIFSGMEYTEVCTATDYKKQLKVARMRSYRFVIIFSTGCFIFIRPSSINDSFNAIAVSILAGLMLYFINYFSLKKSYKKNKELL